MRLVLDTNVIVAAFRSDRGASAALVKAALDRKFVWLVSPALFLEYEAVLSRPEHGLGSRATAAEIAKTLDAFADV